MAKKFEMDMTSGPLLKKIILFSLPIIGIHLIQLLFHAADVAVLGIFSSDSAVAAVGATASITGFMTSLFIGFSVGANVLVGKAMGAGDKERGRRVIGTSVFISIIFGFFLTVVGILCSRLILNLMNCPASIIDMADKYLKINFLGMPVLMLYNYNASILRAVGDSFRPFLYLCIGGILNIGLNIFFIVVLKKDVEGVAIATTASRAFTAIFTTIDLIKGEGFAKLEKKHFKFYKDEFKELFKIGFPSGLQKSTFSLSNVVLNSTLNSFGEVVLAANTIAHEFDAIVNQTSGAIATGMLSFVSQNLGAKNFKRTWLTILESTLLVVGVGLTLGLVCFLFGRELCGIMTDSNEVIEYGVTRLSIMGVFYFLTGIMNVFANVLKGIGKATIALIGSLICTVAFRVLWVYLIFPLNPTLIMYYTVYPLSWLLCIAFYASFAIPHLIKKQKEHQKELAEREQKESEDKENTLPLETTAN